MKLRSKKLVARCMVCVVILSGVCQLYQSYYRGLEFEKRFTLKVSELYQNFLYLNFELDNDQDFVDEFQRQLDKYKHDKEFWYLNNTRHPYDVELPYYYEPSEMSNKEEKPPIQPFDPRVTIAIYLLKAQDNPDEAVKFHWLDWVDISNLNSLILTPSKPSCDELFNIKGDEELIKDSPFVLNTEQYCQPHDSPIGFKITQASMQQTIENNAIIASSYLYSSLENPLKIVVLSKNGDYHIEVDPEPRGLLENGYPELVSEKFHIDKKIDVLESYNSFIDRKTHIKKFDEMSLNSFMFDAQEKINVLSSNDNLSANQKNYLKSLEYSLSLTQPPKYFNEPKLLHSIKERLQGDHYDWRFFGGLTKDSFDHRISLVKLVQNFLAFCNNEGIVAWIAHGTLLSWYWSGEIFPWDFDLDFQLPIGELNKLAENFNRLVIIEDTNEGMGRYYLDITSSITYRIRGNGQNNIDGRFIDIDTGLYIDLTGLAITDQVPPKRLVESEEFNGQDIQLQQNERLGIANCRNRHFLAVDEILPLKKYRFHDLFVLIPSKAWEIINDEYDIQSLLDKNHRDWIFLKNLRIWAFTQDILDYIYDKDAWMNIKQPQEVNESEPSRLDKRRVGHLEKFVINLLTKQDHLNLMSDRQLLQQYLLTNKYTRIHMYELNGIKLKTKIDTPVFKLDCFWNKYYTTGWDYPQEIEKVMRLTREFQTLEQSK